MERKHENNSTNSPATAHPAQNELDLGFNQMEPITPKKMIKPEPSIFDRAKNVFTRKENNDNIQFAVRKEPTFGQPAYNPVSSNINVSADINIPATTAATVESKNMANENGMPKVAATGFTDAMKSVTEKSPVQDPVEPIEPVVVESIKASAETELTLNEGIATMENTEANQTVSQESEQTIEPTKNFVDISETGTQNEETAPVAQAVEQEEIPRQAEQSAQETPENAFEPVVTPKANIKNPENWGILQQLPLKHRRLFIAILGFVVLLTVFFWLKPDPAPTVDDFQAQNGNALPIEFQPLVQNQNDTDTQTPLSENIEDHGAAMSRESDNSTDVSFSAEAIELAKTVAALSIAKTEQALSTEEVKKAEADVTDTAKAETTALDKPQAAERIKPSEPKTVQHKPQTPKVEPQRLPVVEAKPAKTTTQPMGTGNAKTLVVPQGVSLMQVFRNHKLNIADVNAMTKAPGAGNVLSSFNPGDRVQVLINEQGRVTQLRLSNGATFIRQANGTYKYHR